MIKFVNKVTDWFMEWKTFERQGIRLNVEKWIVDEAIQIFLMSKLNFLFFLKIVEGNPDPTFFRLMLQGTVDGLLHFLLEIGNEHIFETQSKKDFLFLSIVSKKFSNSSLLKFDPSFFLSLDEVSFFSFYIFFFRECR